MSIEEAAARCAAAARKIGVLLAQEATFEGKEGQK